MFADLQGQIKYILTYRLNQDVTENFFGLMRAKGGLHDHPDQQEFKFRLRSHLLGRNNGILSSGGNTAEDNTPDLEVPSSSMTGCILLSHLVLLIPNYFLCRTDSKQREVFSTVDRP